MIITPHLLLLLASLLLLAGCVAALIWIACDRPPLLPALAFVAVRLSWLTAPFVSLASRLRPSASTGPLTARSARSSTPTAAAAGQQTPEAQSAMSQSPLYTHVAHPHVPQNANERHKAAIASGGVNQRIALWVTTHVGTMQCAYLFLAVGIGSLVGIFTGNVVLAAVFGSISSYVLQLVLLPILSVGQNVAADHQSLQADEQYNATVRTLHESDQHRKHLNAQDDVLVAVAHKLDALLTMIPSHPSDTDTPASTAAIAITDPADTTPATPVPVPAVGRARRTSRTKSTPTSAAG